MTPLTPRAVVFLSRHRVARLATADASGQPHVVPVCFAFDGKALYSVLDRKPKRVPANQLRRLRNIVQNPRVAFLVDDYSEDWSTIGYLLIFGLGEVLSQGEEHAMAINLLRDKYPQYREMDIDDSPVIRVTPQRLAYWSGKEPRG